MNNLQVIHFSKFLKELSTYVKNLIVYKSMESGRDHIHIKSFQGIIERRFEESRVAKFFFNGSDSITKQLLDYLISCGEIINLGSGYYAMLPPRNVLLPQSQAILKVGQLKVFNYENSNLGLAMQMNSTFDKTISLLDYRYDYSLQDWMTVFKNTENRVVLFNEEYYKPTPSGFKKISRNINIKEGNLYYIISHTPLREMKEHFIARKINEDWLGEQINNNLYKSNLALLTSQGYCPNYLIKKLDKNENEQEVFQISLSDFLPKAEREQVYLFSLPKQLKYCKEYYVQKPYLKDFIFVLSKLGFTERDDE